MKNKLKRLTVLSLLLAVSISLALSTTTNTKAAEKKYFFKITCLDIPGYRTDIHEINKAALAEIGIEYELVTMDMASIDEISLTKTTTYEEGGWDCFMQGKSMVTPGKHPHFYAKRVETGNWLSYSNGRMDDLIDQGLLAFDFESQKEVYDEIQGIFLDELPMIIFWQSINPILIRSDVDTGPTGYDGISGDFAYKISKMSYPDHDKLIYALPWPMDSFNPVFDIFWQGVYEPLLYADSAGVIHSHLAESWEISEDGLTYTFNLRDDVLWHDGEPFTSKDVKFTYEAMANPETLAQPYASGPTSQYIDYIEAPDDYTVIIHVKSPNSALMNDVFANNWVNIVPEHVLKDIPYSEWKTNEYNTGEKILPGLGPYKLAEVVEGEYYRYEANPDYFEGEPSIKEWYWKIMPSSARDTVLASLETGEVDIASNFYYWADVSPKYEGGQVPGVKVEDTQAGGVNFIFNHNHPILSNKWVRKAINYAIPR